MTWKEKTGKDLLVELKKYGLAPSEIYDSDGNLREAALQERLRSAKNSMYARRAWIIALVSSIASVISAITAIIVVLTNR
ncbi:MAG: hypothetical protein V1853_03660 [bacterium]